MAARLKAFLQEISRRRRSKLSRVSPVNDASNALTFFIASFEWCPYDIKTLLRHSGGEIVSFIYILITDEGRLNLDLLNKSDPITLNIIGLYFYFEKQDFDSAKILFSRSIRKMDSFGFYLMALYYYKLGNYPKMLETLARIPPGPLGSKVYALANNMRGVYYDSIENNYEKAVESLVHAIKLDSKCCPATFNLGQVYKKNRMFDLMEPYFNNLIKNAKCRCKYHSLAFRSYGQYLATTGTPDTVDKMLKLYDAGIKKEDYYCAYLLANYYDSIGNTPKKLHFWRLAADNGVAIAQHDYAASFFDSGIKSHSLTKAYAKLCMKNQNTDIYNYLCPMSLGPMSLGHRELKMNAQFFLGRYYYYHSNPEKHDKAQKYFLMASREEHVESKYFLALIDKKAQNYEMMKLHLDRFLQMKCPPISERNKSNMDPIYIKYIKTIIEDLQRINHERVYISGLNVMFGIVDRKLEQQATIIQNAMKKAKERGIEPEECCICRQDRILMDHTCRLHSYCSNCLYSWKSCYLCRIVSGVEYF